MYNFIAFMIRPLAFRLRPTKLDEVIGQEDLVGENGFLRKSVENKTPFSFILFGEPGTGKTTIAECYANEMGAKYYKINATSSNKKDLVDAINDSKNYECPILIIDEIHRLNKDKQDILLPALEDGTIYLIGATTANPCISINKAIRSRCHLLEVKKLTVDQLQNGLGRAISSKKGLDNKINITNDSLRYITLEKVKKVIKVPNSGIDNDGDGHYDAVSALQKSIRGGDVNAAIFYASRLLASGDLDSLTRRLLVTAYEDIGIANPQACMRTKIAIESAYEVGLPEAIIPISVAIVDLALSPKSKAAYQAMAKAMEISNDFPLDVLDYLKYTPVNVSEDEKYPYDQPEVWPHLQYLPDIIKNMKFFIINPSTESSYEKFLNEQYKKHLAAFKSKDIKKMKQLYKKK